MEEEQNESAGEYEDRLVMGTETDLGRQFDSEVRQQTHDKVTLLEEK